MQQTEEIKGEHRASPDWNEFADFARSCGSPQIAPSYGSGVYVAFSRPQKVLVLTAHETPKDHFVPIWQGLPQWPYVEHALPAAQRFTLHNRMSQQCRHGVVYGDGKVLPP